MMVAIENVYSAIDQIAQTTLRKVVGQHSLDHTLSETDKINLDICKILDVSTVEWGVEVTLVELKDIQLPARMKRAMARQAEAERESQVEIGADKNTTVVFPAPLMTTIAELGTFLARATAAAGPPSPSASPPPGGPRPFAARGSAAARPPPHCRGLRPAGPRTPPPTGAPPPIAAGQRPANTRGTPSRPAPGRPIRPELGSAAARPTPSSAPKPSPNLVTPRSQQPSTPSSRARPFASGGNLDTRSSGPTAWSTGQS